MASKYQPLSNFLAASAVNRHTLAFMQVEIIIHDKLPDAAVDHQAWWANDASPGRQSNAWASVGWQPHADPGATISWRAPPCWP